MGNNELVHYGVLGMKWGVTKKKKSTSTSSKSNKKTKEKSVKDMTDDELRKKINRKRLENDYEKIVKPEKVSLGRKFINDALIPGITEGSKNLISQQITKKGNEYLDNIFEKLYK